MILVRTKQNYIPYSFWGYETAMKLALAPADPDNLKALAVLSRQTAGWEMCYPH